MDFGVYSLVDVLVCKDSENRAKCKINRDLFSFLMEHQGQVGFPERYRFLFQQIPTAIIFQHLHLLDGNLVDSPPSNSMGFLIVPNSIQLKLGLCSILVFCTLIFAISF